MRRLSIRLPLVLAIVTVFLPGWARASLAAPTLTLSKTSGPPIVDLTISGSGFGASEAIDVYWDTSELRLVVPNGTGAFSGASISVPLSTTAGQHWITAVGRTSHFAAQAAFQVHGSWPQYHGGARHEGTNPLETGLGPPTVGGLEQAWSVPVAQAFLASPIVVDGIVYTTSTLGKVLGYEEITGALVYTALIPGGHEVDGTPAVSGGTLYVASLDKHVYAFDATTGALSWKSATAGAFRQSSVVVSGGEVFVGGENGKLYAFPTTCASPCAPLWSSAAVGTTFEATPAVADGIVSIGSSAGTLYAFPTTCSSPCAPSWTTPLGGNLDPTPVVTNGVVYASGEGMASARAWALNARTGATIWSATIGQLGSFATASPTAVADGVVYVGGGSGDTNMYALDAKSGTQLWYAPTGASITSAPAVANGVVYVGSLDQSLYAFPASCSDACHPLWTAVTGSFVESAPAVVDASVFVGADDGRLYGYDLGAGSIGARRPDPASLRPAFLASARSGTAPSAAASLTLSKTSGPATTALTVSGSGFGPNEAVDLSIDLAGAGLAVSNATGSFSNATITIPGSASPGNRFVTAIGRGTGSAAQKTFTVRADWAAYRDTPNHKAWNVFENRLGTTNVSSLEESWVLPTSGSVSSSPAVAGGVVYEGSTDGTFYAIDPATGVVKWAATPAPSTAIRTSPAVSGSTVYVGTDGGKLYAYPTSCSGTCTPTWSSVATGGAMSGSPAVSGGVVYAPVSLSTGGGAIDAFPTTCVSPCSPVWTATLTDIPTSPAVANGGVFVAEGGGDVIDLPVSCSNPCNPIWTAHVDPTGIEASPAIAHGVLYITTDGGLLVALQAATGGILFQYAPVGTPFTASPAVANGVVYAASDDGKVYAYPAAPCPTGCALLWSSDSLGIIASSSPAVANGVVYVGASTGSPAQGVLAAFPAGGCGAPICSALWEARAAGPYSSSPAVANGSVFVGSDDGSVYAYAPPIP